MICIAKMNMKLCKRVSFVILISTYVLSNYYDWIDLKKSRTDLEAMKKQAESTNSEFDRLSSEYQKLQVRLSVNYVVS